MSLRVKMFLSFLMISILPLSILIALYYYDARTKLETMEVGNLQAEAEKLADHIDGLLTGSMDTVRHLSHNAQVLDFLPASEPRDSTAADSINRWLDHQVEVNPELYAAFYVMTPEGLCVASSSRDFIGQDYSFRPYFQHARQGRTFLTDLFVGVTSHAPGIYASAPIFLDGGELAGVLVLKFNAAYIFRALQPLNARRDMNAFVVNKMGIVLGHSSPEYRYQSLVPLSAEHRRYINSIQQFAGIQVRSLDMPELEAALSEQELNAPHAFSYIQNALPTIGIAVMMAEEEWLVVVSKSVDSISGFSKALFLKTLLIAGASILLILPVAYILGSSVFIRPLRALFHATEQIGRGDYSQRVPVESRDEIGSLALAFNNMSDSLKQYRDHQEELVEERSRKLLESEANYRFLFDSVPVGIGLVDYTGRILHANRCMMDMVDYNHDELQSMSVNSIYTNVENRKLVRDVLQKHGFTRDWETELRRKDGTFYHALLNVDQIELNGEKVLLTTVRDITEPMRRKQELQKAKEAAEAASHVKNEFLANMSHELRTPLNGILGYAQILNRDTSLTELQRERVAFIERSGNHLLTLITDILDLAKIEAGKLDMIPTEFHPTAFLKDIVEMIHIKAQQKGLKFIYDPPENIRETLYADEIRLRQILLNLLGNAVKFTRQGSIHFRVSSIAPEPHSSGDTHASTIRFEVEDSGDGIPHEQLTAIFRSFEQVGQSHSQAEGSGLGLAISRRLARMLDSEIFVESTLGEGSRFWFDVKFSEAPDDYAAPGCGGERLVSPRDRMYFQEIIGFKGEKRTILLVDNKPENRVVLRDMLSPLGFDVLEADTGDEAFAYAEKFRPDLILMVLKLPGKNGFQTVRDIRQCRELEDIPVIAVSASVHDEVRQKSIEAGFHGFIEKPVHFELLLETLTVFLQIEWSYASLTPADESRTNSNREENASLLEFPPVEVLSALQELVGKGMVLEVRRQMDRLEHSDEKYASFTEKIRRMNKEFRFEELETFLQQAIHREDRHEC